MPSVPPVLLGSSRLMAGVRAQIAQLASCPFAVRVEGPTGSGKGVAARLLHALSPRAAQSFLVCSLAMLPDGMDLDELVGHRRGAFTGAFEDRAGVFEVAHQGTLFLDEVGEASQRVQQYLLRLLDEKVTRRQGEHRDRPVDVRLVMATNRDLRAQTRAGRFRTDLLARMGALVVQMPALADHTEDIPVLAAHFLASLRQQAQHETPPLAPEDLARLMAYPWPLNVRELRNAIEHYVVFGRFPDAVAATQPPSDWRRRLDAVLAQHRGNKAQASRTLAISRESLYRELRRRAPRAPRG